MSESDIPHATARLIAPGLTGRLQALSLRLTIGLSWVIGALALTVLVSALIIGVGDRFLTKAGLAWPEEIGRLSLVWVTFAGATIAAAQGRHFSITLDEGRDEGTPPATFSALAVSLAVLLLGCFLAYEGWILADVVSGQTLSSFDVSVLWLYVPFLWFAMSLVLFEAFSVVAIGWHLAAPPAPAAGGV